MSALASRKLNFVQGDFWAVKNVNFDQVGLFLMCFFQVTLILDFSGFRLDVEVFWFVYELICLSAFHVVSYNKNILDKRCLGFYQKLTISIFSLLSV